MNERETANKNYQSKKSGFSFTELFLICSLGVVTYMLGYSVGHEKGVFEGQTEIKRNSKPAAVITHSGEYIDNKGRKKGKLAFVFQKYDTKFFLDQDENLSRPNLEVFVSPQINEDDKRALVSFLNDFENRQQ